MIKFFINYINKDERKTINKDIFNLIVIGNTKGWNYDLMSDFITNHLQCYFCKKYILFKRLDGSCDSTKYCSLDCQKQDWCKQKTNYK